MISNFKKSVPKGVMEEPPKKSPFSGYDTIEGFGTWQLDDTGCLYINGTGPMPDWSWNDGAPWKIGVIRAVYISDGVTNIGRYAFYSCFNLAKVIIPVSVTTIGAHAFGLCRSLTEVTVPGHVTYIGDSAFEQCSSLTSITIPDSVTSLGGYAFARCVSLTHITIPDSVTDIGTGIFEKCPALRSITMPVRFRDQDWEELRQKGGKASFEEKYGCSKNIVTFI